MKLFLVAFSLLGVVAFSSAQIFGRGEPRRGNGQVLKGIFFMLFVCFECVDEKRVTEFNERFSFSLHRLNSINSQMQISREEHKKCSEDVNGKS